MRHENLFILALVSHGNIDSINVTVSLSDPVRELWHETSNTTNDQTDKCMTCNSFLSLP